MKFIPKSFLWVGLIVACLITLDTQAGYNKSGIILQVEGAPAGVSESTVRIVSADRGRTDMTMTIPTGISAQVALKPGTYSLVLYSADPFAPPGAPVIVQVERKAFATVILEHEP